jgi:Domain of unknown function (DUF932)
MFANNNYRTLAPLSHDQMRRVAPSIFAVEPHDSRSARYVYIPTVNILDALAKEGFQPIHVAQSRCRSEDKREYTKHLIRLVRMSDIERIRKMDPDGTLARRHIIDRTGNETQNACWPEVLLKNAHDGSSAYELFSGMTRLVCWNGAVTQDEGAGIKVQHKGNITDAVIEGTYSVIDEAINGVRRYQDWQGVQLNNDERRILAEEAHAIRFGDEGGLAEAIRPERLLTVRRREDVGNTLRNAFDVIQENVIKGGLHGVAHGVDERTGRRTTRKTSSRAVNGIDADIRLNAALHRLAAKMAELKTGVAA